MQVVHSPEKFIQFATSVKIDGGRARVATLKRSEFLHGTGIPAFILLREATEGDSPVGDVLAKFGSISQAVLAIHTSTGSITKSNLRKEEGGVTISRFNLTHYPETCIETFLDIPMFEDHKERFATLMDVRIVEICRPGVLLSQVSYSDLIADDESHLDDDNGWVEIKVESKRFICLNDLTKRIIEKEIFAVNQIKQGNKNKITVSESLIRTAMNCKMVQVMVVYLLKGSSEKRDDKLPIKSGDKEPMVSGYGLLPTTGYSFPKIKHSSSAEKTRIITMKSEVSQFGRCVGNCTDLQPLSDD